MRQQRTLRHAIGCAGVGLHSGARVAVTLRPAAEGSGIRFRRVDRPGSAALAARPHNATAAAGGTGLASGTTEVRMVEHLMAALLACEIDNALVEVSGAELPAMDGSARPFVLLVECAGTVEQARLVPGLRVLRPVEVTAGRGWAQFSPAEELELTVEPVPTGAAPPLTLTCSPEACKREIVAARHPACRGTGTGEGEAGETLRHAAVDALGTLALVSARIAGRYAERDGDARLRCALLRRLLDDGRNWRLDGVAPEEWLAPAPLAWAS